MFGTAKPYHNDGSLDTRIPEGIRHQSPIQSTLAWTAAEQGAQGADPGTYDAMSFHSMARQAGKSFNKASAQVTDHQHATNL